MILAALDSSHVMVITFVGIGASIAIVGILSASIQAAARTRRQEQTRSELAAYVAEGSMTADEAERILKAGTDPAGRKA